MLSVWKLLILSPAHYIRYRYMIKYGYCFLFMILISACQQKSSETQKAKTNDSVGDGVIVQSDSISTSAVSHKIPISSDSIIEGHVLMPVRYRVWGDPVSKIINNNWLELHLKDGSYAVTSALYHIENEDEEPCSGLPTEMIVPKEDVLLFFNIPTIQKGSVDSIAFPKPIIEPGEPFQFTYQNQKYQLQASGIRFYKDEERNNPNTNYTLKLYRDGKLIRTLINQSSYNDTATELKFIGDLDRDGQLDFIFSSPRDYEEMRLLIILSGSPQVYEGTMQFDC